MTLHDHYALAARTINFWLERHTYKRSGHSQTAARNLAHDRHCIEVVSQAAQHGHTADDFKTEAQNIA